MNNVKSLFLGTTPSALKGAARVMDLFGNLDEYRTAPIGKVADQEALGRDWEIVGEDMRMSVHEYGRARE